MKRTPHPQLSRHGDLHHFLTTEGLPRDMLVHLLDTAAAFVNTPGFATRQSRHLAGRAVATWFPMHAEDERTGFVSAAERLSADVLREDPPRSGGDEATSFFDLVRHPSLTAAALLIVRHDQSGAPFFVARHCAPHTHVINAGDGCHADPTRALRDLLLIRHAKADFRSLTVAIVGDVLHSGAARSLIHALTTLGVPELRAIGPRTLLPRDIEHLGIHVHHNPEAGLRDVDVIVVLPLTSAWATDGTLPSKRDYAKCWRLTPSRLALAKTDAIVLHLESHLSIVDPTIAAGKQSAMSGRDEFALAARMAVMAAVTGSDR